MWKVCDKLSGRCRFPASTPVASLIFNHYKKLIISNYMTIGKVEGFNEMAADSFVTLDLRSVNEFYI